MKFNVMADEWKVSHPFLSVTPLWLAPIWLYLAEGFATFHRAFHQTTKTKAKLTKTKAKPPKPNPNYQTQICTKPNPNPNGQPKTTTTNPKEQRNQHTKQKPPFVLAPGDQTLSDGAPLSTWASQAPKSDLRHLALSASSWCRGSRRRDALVTWPIDLGRWMPGKRKKWFVLGLGLFSLKKVWGVRRLCGEIWRKSHDDR